MSTVVLDAPMSNPPKGTSIESFNPAVPSGMTRIGTNEIHFRPQVLDVLDDIGNIHIVELELLGLWEACDLLHVPGVVGLQDCGRTKDGEDVNQCASHSRRTLVNKSLRPPQLGPMIVVIANVLEPFVGATLHVDEIELASLAKSRCENGLVT